MSTCIEKKLPHVLPCNDLLWGYFPLYTSDPWGYYPRVIFSYGGSIYVATDLYHVLPDFCMSPVTSIRQYNLVIIRNPVLISLPGTPGFLVIPKYTGTVGFFPISFIFIRCIVQHLQYLLTLVYYTFLLLYHLRLRHVCCDEHYLDDPLSLLLPPIQP